MLGLITTLYYLTATYRRSPRFRELALPLIPGLCSWRSAGPAWPRRTGCSARSGRSATCRPIPARSPIGGDTLFYVFAAHGLAGRDRFRWRALLALGGEVVESADVPPRGRQLETDDGDGTVKVKLDARGRAMQRTAATVKPLSNFIYRTMQVGVLLIAAGTILGGVWADYSWGRFWGWDPKEVWALITLAGLPDPAPRPVRRLGQHVRAGRRIGRLLPVGHHGLVRRELRAGSRAAQLRLRRRGLAGDHEGDPLGVMCSPWPPAGAGSWVSTSRRPIPKLSRRPSRSNRARFGRGSRGQVVHLRHRDSLVDDLGTDDPVRDARE